MKHVLALIIGLALISLMALLGWVVAYHEQIVGIIVVSFIILGFAWLLGWKVLNEFKK